jgi:signal transduction histidine kinase
MRRLVFSLVTLLFMGSAMTVGAQGGADGTNAIKQQAEQSLGRKEYAKARSLFIRAYGEYAAKDMVEKAVDCGFQANRLNILESKYKEAFDLYRDINQYIRTVSAKTGNPLNNLLFNLAKEKMQLCIKLRSDEQARLQVERMAEAATQMGGDSINEELQKGRMTYYYAFGNTAQGDDILLRLLNKYKSEKNYEKIKSSFQELISMAVRTNNASLTDKTYKNYIVWSDSVKALSAQDDLAVLQRKYDESLQANADQESSITYRTAIIIALCVVVGALVVLLVLIFANQVRLKMKNNKLKKGIEIANEHNEMKTKFIHNISSQIAPVIDNVNETVDGMSASANEKGAVKGQTTALTTFMDHIQELSELESTLDTPYEMGDIQVGSFCNELGEKLNPLLADGVTVAIEAPKLLIKSNKEQLERLLMHLLSNAAEFTKEGHIRLEYKRRGAHTHQFIVSDTGCGVAEELRDDIFKPFKQVDNLANGDGLGLPICNLIAMKLNGSLSLDTSYKKGCRFVLELHS